MSKPKEGKLTKLEKNWILYDVANSAYVMFACTLIPIFFDLISEDAGLSEHQYLAYWSYAASIATILSMFAGPFFGAQADKKGKKKGVFLGTLIAGCIACAACGFSYHWVLFLCIFILGKVAFNISLVVYDSMLGDITDEDRIDEVSSHGYAWGYIGSCIPFVVCLVIYVLAMLEIVPISEEIAISIGFVLTAIWWFVVSMPLYKTYQQENYISTEEAKKEANLFTQLGHSIKEAAKDRKILLFLIAFFFYIDGVYTIIEEATAFGTSLGLNSIGLLSALLVTQIVAFPSAIIIGKLSKKYSVEKLIVVCIIAYFCVGVYAIFLHTLAQFWILACCVGMFQGGVQALSRSYFTKIIPAEKSGELFGLYDVFGKGATFLGTFLVGAVTQATNNQNIGVAALTIFFVIGLIIFILSTKQDNSSKEEQSKEEV